MKEKPEAIEVEKKLLSALLLKEGEAIPEATEKLRAGEFYRPEHRLIYATIISLYSRGIIPDVLLIEEELAKRGEMNKLLRDYLFGLIDEEWTTARVGQYCEIIRDKARRRRLMEVGEELTYEAQDETKDLSGVIGTAEDKLLKVANIERPTATALSDIAVNVLREAYARKQNGGRLLGISTGLMALDKVTGGLKDSDLIILAARPSMGKTALALNIALNAARRVPVLMFSLEMSTSQLGQRMLAITSGVEASKIQTGNYDDAEQEKLLDGAEVLGERKMYIDDGAGMNIAELRMRSRRHKQKHEIGLIVVDYIQLITGSKEYRGNRVQEVSEISRGLKSLARELNIPILALSQLSRGVEQRADKRPQLADLRESGSIEQDADIVAFIYREEYYNPEENRAKNLAEVLISKNRNGATGRANLRFDAARCLFQDYIMEQRGVEEKNDDRAK